MMKARILDWRIWPGDACHTAYTAFGEYVVQKEDDFWRVYKANENDPTDEKYANANEARLNAQRHFDDAVQDCLAVDFDFPMSSAVPTVRELEAAAEIMGVKFIPYSTDEGEST